MRVTKINIYFFFSCSVAGIYFKITGYGKCSWNTILQRSSQPTQTNSPSTEITNNSKDMSMQYSGYEEYLNSSVYLSGTKNGKFFFFFTRIITFSFVIILCWLMFCCFFVFIFTVSVCSGILCHQLWFDE